MDVFDYLATDETHLFDKLHETYAQYSVWTRDQVFEETKNNLDGLRNLFHKEALLTQNLKDESGMQDILATVDRQRQDILTEADNLVMIHVDEPGFEDGLGAIADKFREHVEYCQNTFYPSVLDRLSPEDRKKINDQLEQKILD
jgi:hypothetical protein